MSGYESDEEGQSMERSPRRHHADRRNVPVSNHRQQRPPASRPQVHQQMPPLLQPPQSQRSPPPQDRNFTAHVSQHPATRFSDRPGGQQYHEDTYGRPFPSEEAQLWSESRHERRPGFTPYHDQFQNMRPGASQYPTTFTTRAVSGSNAGAGAPYSGPSYLQARHNRVEPPEDPELHNVHLPSTNPLAISPGTGDYPYPQTLDLPPGQPSQANIPYHPSAAYSPNTSAHNTPYSSRPYIPQPSLGAPQDRRNNLSVASQRQRSTQRPTPFRDPSTTANYPSTRCQHGCSVPPGYHCRHVRE